MIRNQPVVVYRNTVKWTNFSIDLLLHIYNIKLHNHTHTHTHTHTYSNKRTLTLQDRYTNDPLHTKSTLKLKDTILYSKVIRSLNG